MNRSLAGALTLSALLLVAGPRTVLSQPASRASGGANLACVPPSFAKAGVTITSATLVRDANGERCHVEGVAVTSGAGAPDGQAHFGLDLPTNWNGKYLYVGSGGYGGTVAKPDPAIIKRGYAVVGSDSGHLVPPGEVDASGRVLASGVDDLKWTRLANGERNTAPIIDFYFRAQRSVNAAVRPMVGEYYGRRADKAIFMGCSGGARQAMLEAQDRWADYDGFIAIAPAFETTSSLSRLANVRGFLQTPISFSKIAAVSAEFRSQCDAADGVRDDLVQNPAACRFNPDSLVGKGILTAPQAKELRRYMSAVRDSEGEFVAFGFPISDLAYRGLQRAGGGVSAYMTDPSPAPGAEQPWGGLITSPIGWRLSQPATRSLIFNRPDLDVMGPEVFAPDGTLVPGAVAMARRYMRPDIPDPSRMGPFLKSGHKLMIVHGWADPLLTPYATIRAYDTMSKVAGGPAPLSRSLRLFMVPEMQHCVGGSGPHVFDALSAMESWLDKGAAPMSLLVTKFEHDDPKGAVLRTMPVCAYPAMATYKGQGDVRQAANWTCKVGDRRGARIGEVGRLAGL